MKNIVAIIVNTIGQKNPKFVAIKGYQNQEGEVSNYLINTGVKYANLVKKDIEFLKNLKTENELSEKARLELLTALEKNRNEETASAGSLAQKDAYTYLTPSLRICIANNTLQIVGYREQKTVLVEGVYPVVNSRPLTIEKNKIRRNLKTSKFRPFTLGKMEGINMNGLKIEGWKHEVEFQA